MFFSTRSANRQMRRPRSLADILRQGPPRSSKARRAACTARSTSSREASTTWVSTSPVAVIIFFSNQEESPKSFVYPSDLRGYGLQNVPVSLRSCDTPSKPSLRFERRRAFLHVGRQPFFRVFTLEEQL